MVASIGLVALLATMGHAAFVPILPLYLKENLGFSASFIGIVFGAYAVSETVFKTPFGFISDRVGRKAVIVTGILLSFVVPILMTLLRHPAGLIFLQAVNGAGIAAFWPVLAALISDNVTAENRAQAMTVFNLAYLIALCFGPALGAFVNHATGNNVSAFYLAAVFLAAAAITGIAVIPGFSAKESVARSIDARPERKEKGRLLKILFIQPILARMFVISLLQQFGIGLLAPIFILFSREQLSFTQADIGHILLWPAIVVALLAVPLGHAADVIGKARVTRYAYLVSAPAIYLFTVAKSLAAWQVLISLVGLAYVTGAPAWTALVSMAAPHGKEGTTIAAVSTMYSLGFIIGPGVGGLLYDYISPAAPFYGCSVVLLFCSLLVFLLVSEEKILAAQKPAEEEAAAEKPVEQQTGSRTAAGK